MFFWKTYADLDVQTYAVAETDELWRERLRGTEIVILHEWNSPALAQRLLAWRKDLGYKLLFHDTHHRASSSPAQMEQFGLAQFDASLRLGNPYAIFTGTGSA